MPERTTAQRLKEGMDAVMLRDAERQLKFADQYQRAGLKELEIKLEDEEADSMIVGDVTINNSATDTKSSTGLPKWAGLALAGLGAMGGLGLPAMAIFAKQLFSTTVIEQPVDEKQYGIGLYKPKAVKTAVPSKSDGITVVSAPWCRPCRIYKNQVLSRLIKEGYHVKIIIKDKPGHAVPMTHFFLNGKMVDKEAGIIPYNRLKSTLVKP